MESKKAINLLLLGRNGNGKSSTGNSILGRREFTPSSCTSAGCDEETIEKLEKQKKETKFPNMRVTLVEGPGLGDANLESEEDVRLTFQKVETSLRLCTEGFEVILFVLKYGVRFTQQEKETVLLVKRIFGERVFVEHGLVVMTYGDSFEQDMEDEDKTFGDWCREQNGDMRALLSECDYRVILFNNRKKDDAGQDQVARLLEMVKAVPGRAHPFTMDDYRLAETSRNKLLVSSKLPKLKEETQNILDEVHAQTMLLNLHSLVDDKHTELHKRLDDQKRMLLREDGGLGILKNILERIHVAEMSLITKERIIRDTTSLALFNTTPETPHCSDWGDNNKFLSRLYRCIGCRWIRIADDYKRIAIEDCFPELHNDVKQDVHYLTRPQNAVESARSDNNYTKQSEDMFDDSFDDYEMLETPHFTTFRHGNIE